MTPEEFKEWRANLGYSQHQAADALGVSRGSIENYERGSRREDARPVEIPRTVEFACYAILAAGPAVLGPPVGSQLDKWAATLAVQLRHLAPNKKPAN